MENPRIEVKTVENPKIDRGMSREKIIRIEIKDIEQRELKEEVIGIRERDKKVDRKVEIT